MTTVRDIMSPGVRFVSPDDTVLSVMQFFADQQISGAPVVGAAGEVVGVVSATDLIRVAARTAEEVGGGDTGLGTAVVPPEEYDEEDPAAFFLTPGPFFDLPGNFPTGSEGSPLESVRVREVMTRAAFSVGPDETVAAAADFLLRGRIHRALVVEEGTLLGLVTTFDLLRVLAADTGAGDA